MVICFSFGFVCVCVLLVCLRVQLYTNYVAMSMYFGIYIYIHIVQIKYPQKLYHIHKCLATKFQLDIEEKIIYSNMSIATN